MKNDINVWSVFERCYKKEEKWVTNLIFYKGDLSSADFKNDFRFKEVFQKHKQLKFLGLCNPQFPIKYPLKLNDGSELIGFDFSY